MPRFRQWLIELLAGKTIGVLVNASPGANVRFDTLHTIIVRSPQANVQCGGRN